MYSFLFDRKSLILLVAGLGTVGCLLFFAGLLTGVFWGVPTQDGTATAALPAAVLPASEPCPPATERPFQKAEAGRGESSEETEPASLELDGEPVPMLEAEVPERPRRERREPPTPAIRAALPPTAGRAPSEVAQDAPTTLDLDEAVVSATSAAPTAAPTDSPTAQTELVSVPAQPEPKTEVAALRTTLYSLQVGAFRLPANSARIAQDLRSKGYDAYVLEEKGTRDMLTVRIGRYTDRAEALRAALDFRQREGQEVIVRTLRLGDVRLTSW